MDKGQNWKSRAACWYLAPPPCFTRSAPCPSTNPLENLLLEHPSMSVYLLPVAAYAPGPRSLYQSAPPTTMEDKPAPCRALLRDDSPAPRVPVPQDENLSPVPHRKSKRKRRAKRSRQGSMASVTVPDYAAAAARTALGQLHLVAEMDKQLQHEEKELRTSKKAWSRRQVQRNNQLTRVNIPKKCTVRDGNYRCLQ